MTDSKRGSAEGMSPLTHADAEAFISARLDGPLDSGSNRALLAHLASCDNCRAFARQVDFMSTAVRDIPSLPPSAAVSRHVRAEIRGETAPIRRFSRWVTTSRSAPMGALAAAVVALALVSASVFGPLGDDGTTGTSVNAPNFAAIATGENAGDEDAEGASGGTAAAPPNVQVTESAPNAAFAQGEAVQDAEPEEAYGGDPSIDTAMDADTDQESAPETSASRGGAESGAGLGDGTGGGDLDVALADDEESTGAEATEEPAPTETQEPEPTATEEPVSTETPEPSPAATEEMPPTATPEATPTATEEPTATEPPATPVTEATATPATPEVVATATPEPTSTEEPTTEPAATGTATPGDEEDSPTIVQRPNTADGTSGAAGQTTIQQASDETTDSGTDGTGAAGSDDDEDGADSSMIVSTDSDDSGADDADEETDLADDSAPAAEPVSFSELDTVGTMGSSGVLIPGSGGLYAAEQPGGGLAIVSADGSILASGWGYNPVWSGDGQTVYAADGSLAESGAALISWSSAGGPNYITSGAPAYDTPAGAADGGLYFVRYQPGAEFTLQLRFTGGEDRVVWESSDHDLIGQAIFLYGGEVFAPTNQGWIAIPTGGGEPRNVGSVIGGEYDPVLDHGSGMIAYAAGGSVYVAPAASPGSAMLVGNLGNGGFAWTPWGLALASGGEVSIIHADGSSTTVVTGGGDLTAPVWTGDGLRIADAADGGTIGILPSDVISAILGG